MNRSHNQSLAGAATDVKFLDVDQELLLASVVVDQPILPVVRAAPLTDRRVERGVAAEPA
jgi:hypothetical protein